MTAEIALCFKELTDLNVPDRIYIDTSVVIHSYTPNSPYYSDCQALLANLEKKKSLLIFSKILYPELWCAVIGVHIREKFKTDRPAKYAKDHPKCIQEFFQKSLKVEKKLEGYRHSSIEIEDSIIAKAREIMPLYRVGSTDAIHIATAEVLGITDFAVVDKDIENLPLKTKKIIIWCKNGYKNFTKRNPTYKVTDLSN
jgi:predicted nucleic acid-binding protein